MERGEIERRIHELARRQHGVVTRAQCIELGLDSGAVSRRLASGMFRRLHRGTYGVGPIVPPRAKEMAAVLASGPGAVVSHRSAAHLFRLAAGPRRSDPVDVTVPGHRGGRTKSGIRTWCVAGLASDDWTRVDRIPVTTVRRTLVDFAVVAGAEGLERAVARAEREGLIDPVHLEGLLERYRGRPGIRDVRAVLARSGGPALTESQAESLFLRDVVREGGLPAPRVNAWVEGYRVDFYWPEHHVAVEVDGYRWHSTRPPFEHDRRRTTRLAAAGVQIIRVSWRQIVEESTSTAVLIGQTLVRAEIRAKRS